MVDLWFGTSGPKDAPIVLVGESWGAQEETAQRPFVGLSGQDLDRMLAETGLRRDDILCTNVVAARPYANEMWRFFTPKVQKPERIGGLAPGALVRSEVTRLYAQIAAYPRTLVIAAGAYSTWALSRTMGSKTITQSNSRPVPKDLITWGPTGILSWRGSMIFCEGWNELGASEAIRSIPLLPIIHPAAIQREWYLRSPTVHDLRTRVPMVLRKDWTPCPTPTILATPTFREACDVLDRWLSTSEWIDIAADCETIRPILTCFGFADSTQFALVVPFVRTDGDSITSYWTVSEEAELVRRMRKLFVHPKIRLIGQNFIYDTQYAQHWFGITPRLEWDTMLAQNVLFPGTPKDLGYLSSLYCKYHRYWKEEGKFWNAKEVATPERLVQHLIYNGTDCLRTWEVARSQRKLMTHLGMDPQMKLKMRINDMCLRMMNRGMRVDDRRKDHLVFELQEATTAIERELLAICPQDLVKPGSKTMWYNSPQQKAFLLYDQLGMEPVKNRKTGAPTTGKEAFPILTRKYPEFTGLFERLRSHDKLDSAAEVLSMGVDADGRVRCSFNPGGTETHRLSSSTNAFGRGTNLQNLTEGEEDD